MRHLPSALLLVAAIGCGPDADVTAPLHTAAAHNRQLQYRITPLPTAGPGTSQGAGINGTGLVAGYTGTPTGTREAAIWRDGAITRLGTLPGGLYSMLQWAGVNSRGTVVGISRIGVPDSLGESWSCSAFLAGAGNICHAFVWSNGVMTQLPTLGGTNGFATGINARGQAVGWAETPVHDPTCDPTGDQVLQFHAVQWNTRSGAVTALAPWPGDSASAATAINDRGQVVGISGECDVAVGRRSAIRAVLWDHGQMVDLGSLGGDFWHTPMALNERGEVVGFSNPPGGALDGSDLHAFHWTRRGGMEDLGKLAADASSQALGINARGQIVGVSCGAVCTAMLWQEGQMLKLQDLVPGFTGILWSARSINDAGVITGRMYDANGVPMAYVATPVAASVP